MYDSVNLFKFVGFAEEPVEYSDEIKTAETCSFVELGESCIWCYSSLATTKN